VSAKWIQREITSGVLSRMDASFPRGLVILSPDRTIAALKREVYLRRPEIFKMAYLRDFMNLFNPATETSPGIDGSNQQRPIRTPFYAGFGNRLNDALSYCLAVGNKDKKNRGAKEIAGSRPESSG